MFLVAFAAVDLRAWEAVGQTDDSGKAKLARAARLLGAMELPRLASDFHLTGWERLSYERTLAGVRAALDEEAFADAWTEGQAMTLEQAIVYALEVDTPSD
jgi:hypothetical protein